MPVVKTKQNPNEALKTNRSAITPGEGERKFTNGNIHPKYNKVAKRNNLFLYLYII